MWSMQTCDPCSKLTLPIFLSKTPYHVQVLWQPTKKTTHHNQWQWMKVNNTHKWQGLQHDPWKLREQGIYMHYCLNTIRKLKLHVPWTKMCINLFLSYQHCKTIKSIFKISWNNMSSLKIYITSIKLQFYCLWRIHNIYILDNSNS